ncbi:AAA family ATPase [Sphingomonas paucimobilis]|uniref:DNA, contig: SP630 n=1 Tax=Sphingomonas paucimobilis NBRC 13935 TaxID=1219050 RepID=A0A0C9N3F3_SPHPI|nr:ATP-binding protein [Sphingomonas paucimobilis]GAN14139.1 hypothetical protein SP6_30_02800 [Sphingomonas paucimobilis NBRC 13935]SUJ08208.1 Uncharacterised protein [Sphingomonas paucimobilis]
MTNILEPAQLTNMRLGLATMLRCVEAPLGSPRLGLLYGPSGYGKSVAAATVAARFNAAYVVARSTWTQKSMLREIAKDLGIVRLGRTADDVLVQVIEHLQVAPQPVIIDETDHVVHRKNIEIIRDILDHAGVPVMLIGEEALPAKLKDWERFDNRILIATPAQPSSIADACLLRDYYCPRVAVADDLVDAIVKATRGVTRRIVTNLQDVQARAIGDGRETIDRAAWGTRPFSTGDIPIRKVA